jgi:hypothetical protein
LPTLVIRIPNVETFLFCQHNSTGGGNLELRQTICEKVKNYEKQILHDFNMICYGLFHGHNHIQGDSSFTAGGKMTLKD